MIVKLCYDDYSFLPDRRYNNLSLLSGYLLRLYAKMASRVDFLGSKRTSGKSCFNVIGELGLSGVSLTKSRRNF
ncbi:MAG: hypothetical protein HWD63_01380 [Candidatus Parvibacillus calidus]|nr:MAG: hypothetical protein HWD63_01380 [Candidatus Parvibacillus calidus]